MIDHDARSADGQANAGQAAKLTAALGKATAAAAGGPLAGAAATVIEAILGQVIDAKSRDRAQATAIKATVARVLAGHASRDISALKNAFLHAVDTAPECRSDMELLVAAVQDPTGEKENQRLQEIVLELFKKTGPTEDLDEFAKRLEPVVQQKTSAERKAWPMPAPTWA